MAGSHATGRVPLKQRPLDAFYFGYFLLHFFVTLCIDGASAGAVRAADAPQCSRSFRPTGCRIHWPTSWRVRVRPRERALTAVYIQRSNDPLLPNAWLPRYTWFRVSLMGELVTQVPMFAVGAWCLWHDDQRVYPFMAVYGALAAFTTLQCLSQTLFGDERAGLSAANVTMIVQCVRRAQQARLTAETMCRSCCCRALFS